MGQSRGWMQQHLRDKFVRQAQIDGYVSRAAYKLLEINKKDHVFRPGQRVVDLGAAPGGWCQVAAQLVGCSGKVFALDKLPLVVQPERVEYIAGDFNSDAVYQELLTRLEGKPVEVVLSDMAPNLSGQKSIDQPAMLNLLELAADFARQVLAPGGKFLVKCFHGSGTEQYMKSIKEQYSKVKIRKPEASRSSSSEFYLLGIGKLPGK